jgi:hypothetical protein
MTGPHNRTCGARAFLCGITGRRLRGVAYHSGRRKTKSQKKKNQEVSEVPKLEKF